MSIRINTDYSVISPYPIMIMLSFAAGLTASYLLDRRGGVPKTVCRYLMLLSPMMSVFCGFGLTYITSGGKMLGLSSLGGLIGMYAAVVTLSLINGRRDDTITMFGSCTLALPLMYSVSKIGCTLAGCCRGFKYEGAFGIHYSGRLSGEADVFPVQPLESLIFLGIFISGLLLYLRGRKAAAPVYFTGAAAKFALDFLRQSHAGKILSLTQVLVALLLMVGTVILVIADKPEKTEH